MEVTYTIQMAAKISGVGVHTIRAWEKRYKAIVPKRDVTGHRVYSKEDVEKLILLSELCLLGYSISKIANQDLEELKQQLKALGKNESSIKNLEMSLYENHESEFDYSQSMTIILMALKSFKIDIISKELSKLKIFMSPREFALEVILPIMSELGYAVDRGEFTISHEHALSAILKFHTGHLLYRSHDLLERNYFTILFCGIEQDYHEFGILMGALIALHYQFNIIYLGPNLPADSLIDAAKYLNPNLIVLGATEIVATLGKNYVPNYYEKVLDSIPTTCQMAIGSSLTFEIREQYKKRVKHFKSMEEFDKYLAILT